MASSARRCRHPTRAAKLAADLLTQPRAEQATAVRAWFVTWLVWVFLHLMSLPQLQNRLRVQTQWFWSYYTGQRSARLTPEPPVVGTHEPGS